MALHPDVPSSPHAILGPEVRWFPADRTLREMTMDKLMQVSDNMAPKLSPIF